MKKVIIAKEAPLTIISKKELAQDEILGAVEKMSDDIVKVYIKSKHENVLEKKINPFLSDYLEPKIKEVEEIVEEPVEKPQTYPIEEPVNEDIEENEEVEELIESELDYTGVESVDDLESISGGKKTLVEMIKVIDENITANMAMSKDDLISVYREAKANQLMTEKG